MTSLGRVLMWSCCCLSTVVALAQPPKEAGGIVDSLRERYADTVELRLNVPYAGNDNSRQQLDLCLPKKRNGDGPLPLVVFIHGGGWSGGDRKAFLTPAAALASTGNYVTASIGYRLSAEAKWPNQIHDCKAAIRFLRANASQWNVDPQRIGATGGSAGGHLVTLLGLTADHPVLDGSLGEHTSTSSRITCVINVCGPSDLTTPLMQGEAALKDDPAVVGLIGGGLAEKIDVARQASPLTYVTPRGVPIMTIHGTNDLRVNFTNAERLDAALKEAGVPSSLQAVKGAGHGIPIGPELAGRIQQFWDLHLRGIKSEIATTPIDVTPPPAKP